MKKVVDITLLIVGVIVFICLFIGYDACYACFYAIMMALIYLISK